VQKVHKGNNMLLNKLCCKNGITISCQRMKSDLYLTPYTKTNSELGKDLTLTSKTLQSMLHENIEKSFMIMDLGITS
jgi:hypothetical protein